MWDGNKIKNTEMTWCNNNSEDERVIQLVTSNPKEDTFVAAKTEEIRRITCPSCGHNFEIQDQVYYTLCCVELGTVSFLL